MAFDISTARPERSFDISTAQQQQQQQQQQVQNDPNQDIGALEAGLIGAGRGMYSIGRGLGIADPEDPAVTANYRALEEKHPISTTVGEVAGQTAPFLIPGGAVGGIASLPARAGAMATLGAAEGGIISRGEGQDAEQQVLSAGIGGTVAGGLELALPSIARVGGKIIRRVLGREPVGAVVDNAGNPSAELVQALDAEGLRFDDLVGDVTQQLRGQAVDPVQAARAARFAQEGIPATTGDLTQGLPQQAIEARLFESASDPMAGPLRGFRLKQSQAIRESLEKGLDVSKLPEDTGDTIQGALEGRFQLLRSEKNELYKKAADAAKEIGGVPLFTDDITRAIPDDEVMKDLAVTARDGMNDVNELLYGFGIKEIPEGANLPFEPEILGLNNVERFRKGLNAIERKDTTGAVARATGQIRRALDTELEAISEGLNPNGLPAELVATLKDARKANAKYKKEFDPKGVVGRLISAKKNSEVPVVEASRVYSQLVGKGAPVENMRRVVGSLKNSGEKGAQAIADLKTTALLDLINAGFGTTSRKIDGIPTFNPGAFKKRLDSIGKDKLAAIFKGDSATLEKLRNIEKIAADITPAGAAVPKGSASVIMDMARKLGVLTIGAKIPGGGLLTEAMTSLSQGAQTRKAVEGATSGTMDAATQHLTQTYPALVRALGVSAVPAALPENNKEGLK